MTSRAKWLKTLKPAILIFALIINLFIDTVNVFAIPDVPYYATNNIDLRDRDSKCAAKSSDTNVSGSTVREWIWSYLLAKELTAEQAAGVMGNMQKESGFVPTRHQNPNKSVWENGGRNNAWGLAQWDSGRRYSEPDGGILGKLKTHPDSNINGLTKYADLRYDPILGSKADYESIPVTELKTLTVFELDFLYTESTEQRRAISGDVSEWEGLKQQTSIEQATRYWEDNFERSADDEAKILERIGFATTIYNEMTKKEGTGADVVSSGLCGSSVGNTTVVQEYIVKYAHPQYHPPVYTTKMPEYAEAIKRAKAEGRYVGADGIDCGGFVTTLLYDSGWDKNYNSSGKGGNTEAQEKWLEANWERLGSGDKIDTGTLQPGDVAMWSEGGGALGHTYVWAGDIAGFDSKIASSSLEDRAPMAGRENPTDSKFVWYRKK